MGDFLFSIRCGVGKRASSLGDIDGCKVWEVIVILVIRVTTTFTGPTKLGEVHPAHPTHPAHPAQSAHERGHVEIGATTKLAGLVIIAVVILIPPQVPVGLDE